MEMKTSDRVTTPLFIKEAEEIMTELKKLSVEELETSMKISRELAENNRERYLSWKSDPKEKEGSPALLTYSGEVFQKMKPSLFSPEDLEKSGVRILSAVYGCLKPMDIIMPYRLEMQNKLKIQGKSLYQYWKPKLTEALKQELNKEELILNLASTEYSKAIDLKKLTNPVVTPVFKQKKGDTIKSLSVYAKQARGLFIKYILEQKITQREELKNFTADNYALIEENETELVFLKEIS